MWKKTYKTEDFNKNMDKHCQLVWLRFEKLMKSECDHGTKSLVSWNENTGYKIDL